jgi:ADP-ribose pyrophosphatase
MSLDKLNQREDGAWAKILELVEEYSFGGLFRVMKAKLQYRRFDGHMSEEITRINFERGDSVAVLLHDPDEDVVVLTRQFRYPVYSNLDSETAKSAGAKQAWLLEVVAGSIDPNQNVLEMASKEVMEEAGYVVQGGFRPIATFYPSPGWSSERIHLFLGLVDHKDRSNDGGGLVSEGEDIQVEILSFEEAMMMIDRGEISDAKTIIALQHLAMLKSRGVEF